MQILLCIDHGPLRSALARGASGVGFQVSEVGSVDEALASSMAATADVVVVAMLHPRSDRVVDLGRLVLGLPSASILSLHGRVGLPADAAMIQASVRQILGSGLMVRLAGALHAKPGPTGLRFGELELRPGPCQALQDGIDIRLTPREYRILEHLALRRDQVVSTQELLRGICQTDPDATSNVIAQWVSRVRRKLRRHGAGDPIRTRRGFGYIFSPA